MFAKSFSFSYFHPKKTMQKYFLELKRNNEKKATVFYSEKLGKKLLQRNKVIFQKNKMYFNVDL